MRSSPGSRIEEADGFEPPRSRLPRDEMPCRLHEVLAGIAGQLVAEERRHQRGRGKPREGEESHADVRFAARDVSGGVRRRELRIQIDEEVEPDFVSRDPFQVVEVLVHVHELLRFHVEAGLLVDLAAHALAQALPRFVEPYLLAGYGVPRALTRAPPLPL